MTTWKQQGAKKVSYEPASPECTTNFQTNATIIGPDGKEITPSSIEQDEYGVIPSWSNIPEGSKIVWECRTLSGIGSSSAVSDIWEKEDADKVGKPDRVSIDLQALDLAYVTKITDDVINNLSPQEEEMLLTDIEGVTLLITERVMENMNESLVLKSIYSTIIETGLTSACPEKIVLSFPSTLKSTINEGKFTMSRLTEFTVTISSLSAKISKEPGLLKFSLNSWFSVCLNSFFGEL